MEILSELFGSAARVKLLRLFLFHPDMVFDEQTLAQRSKVPPREIKKELRKLDKSTVIIGKSVARGKKRVTVWSLNTEFGYLFELKQLLITTSLIGNDDVVRRFSKICRVKLLVLSGVFVQLSPADTRLDLLIVADNIRSRGALESVIKVLESEVGREITYAFFETQDFKYRLAMYDKLLRDVLDFKHEKLVNKLNI